ncbi:hypothetical protein SteCoe_16708 [Stentor coeruleus]|uniref:Uncharacterized protein n=1 Tax=Stentor coeruleus TaxID=5963 RepID=A0A1R2C0U3_9CILI|nr:hypothetical protein SteCoe_16708 [Stentor coeruleus]
MSKQSSLSSAKLLFRPKLKPTLTEGSLSSIKKSSKSSYKVPTSVEKFTHTLNNENFTQTTNDPREIRENLQVLNSKFSIINPSLKKKLRLKSSCLSEKIDPRRSSKASHVLAKTLVNPTNSIKKSSQKHSILPSIVKKSLPISKVLKKARIFIRTAAHLSHDSLVSIENENEKDKNDDLDTSSELEDYECQQEKYTISCLISGQLIDSFFDDICQKISQESYNEVFLAHLILFSSSVLDKYLQEVLAFEVYDSACKAYALSKEIEYLDSHEKIYKETIEEEINTIVEVLIKERFSLELCESFINNYSIDDIVKEAVSDETQAKDTIVTIIINQLLEDFYSEEWFDILIEDEINEARLLSLWKLFPEKLQKDYYKTHSSQLINKLAELIYYDYLNDIVGEFWPMAIVNSLFRNPNTEDIEIIMPLIRVPIQARRRLTICTFIN